MVQDLGIAQILSLLGVPGVADPDARASKSASRDTAPGEPRYDIISGDQPRSISRTEARLLLFLNAPIHEWLKGGDPAGMESNLRWSIVKGKGSAADVLEVRIGDREPIRFDRAVASASLAGGPALRKFAQTRG